MATLLKGAPVAAALNEKTAAEAAALREKGIVPTLAIVRVGERDGDLSYEKGATNRCRQLGCEAESIHLPEDVSPERFFAALDAVNRDGQYHGILLLRPLPEQLGDARARSAIAPEKDVDGCTDGSLAGVFANTAVGFPPCTARAAMEILRYYGVDPAGKRAVVIGRSLVIGRPVAMLLLHANATVTVCHTRTADLPSVTREADVVIAASGQMESLGAAYFRPGQTVIDVGIGWNARKGKLCGDVRFEEVAPLVEAITPVPGGVGAVTTGVLASQVVEAAKRAVK